MTLRAGTTSVPPPALRSLRNGRDVARAEVTRLSFDARRA